MGQGQGQISVRGSTHELLKVKAAGKPVATLIDEWLTAALDRDEANPEAAVARVRASVEARVEARRAATALMPKTKRVRTRTKPATQPSPKASPKPAPSNGSGYHDL